MSINDIGIEDEVSFIIKDFVVIISIIFSFVLEQIWPPYWHSRWPYELSFQGLKAVAGKTSLSNWAAVHVRAANKMWLPWNLHTF